MRASSTNPRLTWAKRAGNTQHAQQHLGKQRASPTRPDPPPPVPGPSVGFAFLLSPPIRTSCPFPQTPACCIHAPLSPAPVHQSSQPPGGLNQHQRAGPRDTDLGRGAMGDRNPCRVACFEGCQRGGNCWRRCQLESSKAAFPEAAHTDETKRNNLQTPRIHALSRKKYGQAPSRVSSLAPRSRRSVDKRRDATKNARHHPRQCCYSIIIPAGSGMMRDARCDSSILNHVSNDPPHKQKRDSACSRLGIRRKLRPLLPNKRAPYLTLSLRSQQRGLKRTHLGPGGTGSLCGVDDFVRRGEGE
jgi:hypothetical protein